jgi:hypothetical protein
MIVLVASGYGVGELQTFRLKSWQIVAGGLTVWALGLWTSQWQSLRLTLNLGFGALTVVSFVWILRRGRMGWWTLGLWLAVVATIVRLILPIGVAEASVMPMAVIESLGMGLATGITVAKPLPAALLAAATEGLAAIGFALYHSYHELGRYDLAASMIAALSAWPIAWVAAAIGQRGGQSA